MDRTHVICLDTVGSPQLIQLEAEGMLWMREYPAAFKDLVASCAQEAGVSLRRGLRFRNATGALDNNAEIRTVRRQIGRINTYIRQREIAAAESAS